MMKNKIVYSLLTVTVIIAAFMSGLYIQLNNTHSETKTEIDLLKLEIADLKTKETERNGRR